MCDPIELFNLTSIGVLICLAVVSFPTSIASFIIAGMNWGITCDDSGFMSLGVWHIVNGIVSICYFVVTFVMCGIWWDYPKDEKLKRYLGISIPVILFFKLVWNIIGAVIFFKYGSGCETDSLRLWELTIAVLAFQWFMLLIAIIFLVVFGCSALLAKIKENSERKIKSVMIVHQTDLC